MEALLIQAVSGAVGGNVAGGLLKNLNLGVLGNSVAGIVGGGLGGSLASTSSACVGRTFVQGWLRCLCTCFARDRRFLGVRRRSINVAFPSTGLRNCLGHVQRAL